MLARSLICALILSCAPLVVAAADKAQREQQFKSQVQPLIKKYCFDCHGNGSSEGDFNLDKYDTAQRVIEGRKHWLKVLRRLNAEDMPPKDHDARPTKEEYALLGKFVDSAMNDLDCSGPPVAGHVTMRRLTRYEYRNTVRDLIGVDYEPASSFPADDVGYGFDNIGDVLSLPPLLLEKYLVAADEVSQKAILSEPPQPKSIAELRGSRLLGDGERGEQGERVLSSNGEVYATLDIPTEGEYVITAMARADQAGDEPAKMVLLVDGKQQTVHEVKNQQTREKFEHRAKLSAGKRKFSLQFPNDFYNPQGPADQQDRNLKILKLEVYGPVQRGLESYPETHRRLVKFLPDDKRSWAEAGKLNLRPIASRAFRRPLTESEINRIGQIVEVAKANGDNFEVGMRLGLQAILASPHFLFKVETSPPASASLDTARALNDYELATRLSYFLWSTLPDDELFGLAHQGKLRDPKVLEQQARRMLKDPRSQALVENFAGQWLTLRNLDNAAPNSRQFRQWNHSLRLAMRKETELFIGAVMREDMSLLRLLDADFTYVNGPLAELYGIAGVSGEEFRRVSLAGTPRGGLLTQASILTVTSNPTRTSPVKRGKWILETLLNEPPPPAPPGVPELKDERPSQLTGTLRERMQQHRADPVCNSCHQVMDSLGFALENYDAIGAFRQKEGRFDIDASGELPSGEKISGSVQLRELLLSSKKKEFIGCVTEKMLTYALGRGLEYYDQCTVESIRAQLDKNDQKFSTLVVEVVKSYPFRHQGVKRSE